MPAGADLPARVLEFLRQVTPFAYCDGCLAVRVGGGLAEVQAALATLVAERAIERTRRLCYGCGRTLETAVPAEPVR